MPITLLFFVAVGSTAALLALSHRWGPRRPDPVKDTPYESGEDPLGRARGRLTVPFFRSALLFLVFETVALLVAIWAVSFRTMAASDAAKPDAAARGIDALVAMGIFLLLVGVGYLYAMRKGALEWE